ncbi:MAG: LemA family protein [Alphaproteobacteria bacterium]|nr:LemA family protein [Alphaproteobacteria bacterium]MBV9418977.1 LemA family protein [Alphaproteobacteria bacterium]MBV9542671.1 LemA family protein [Alphaproteobacteria bacterium]MBV9905734.1 LemA family protein [Alphaproteobacteria bacterium]
MVLYIVIGVAVLAVLWAIMTYNGLVSRRAMVGEGWSGIDAQLKRRADLIPNLVETVKGYATHERTTFDELTRMRSQTGSQDPAQRAAAETAITAAIGKVMAVAEAYPDLKASANFQSLQKDLADLEDQIQLARRYYNGTVRNYNVAIQQFPSSLIAGMGGFTPSQFFQLDNAEDRNVPKVSFS